MDGAILEMPPYQLEDAMHGRGQNNVCDTQAFHMIEKLKGLGDKITLEQAGELGHHLDYDGSLLEPEQKRAILMAYFARNVELFGLRSPQYYEDKSQCLSVSETAWPGAVATLKVDSLKRGYIEPHELIKRQRKLKPANNFVLRRFIHKSMQFTRSPLYKRPTRLTEPPMHKWLWRQRAGIYDINRLRDPVSCQLVQEIYEKWEKLSNSTIQTESSGVPFFKSLFHSPGGTLFPRYLVKGLEALRKEADEAADNFYEEEDLKSETARQEAIDEWRKKNPSILLADDAISLYRTWPEDLMNQLDEISRGAIRRGRKRYIDHLREKEKEMQALVQFWRDCGLITGQRTPPSPRWPNPRAKLEGKEQPEYLVDRLSEFNTRYGENRRNDIRQYIEVTRWKEAVLNGDLELTVADTPLPKSLMNDLADLYDSWPSSETEDMMIDKISEWRESKNERRLRRNIQEAQLGLPSKYHRVWSDRLRPRKGPAELEDQTSWHDRLRPRHYTVTTAVVKPRAVAKPTDKLRRVVKMYDRYASKTKRHSPRKALPANSTIQTANNA